MRKHRLIVDLGVALGLLAGCAAGGPAAPVPTSDASATVPAVAPMRASDRMFYWIEEARELHDMADRREREANLLSKNGQAATGNDIVLRMRSLATQLRAAAEYADEQAREAEREVPVCHICITLSSRNRANP